VSPLSTAVLCGLRAAVASDREFLFRVYASTRHDELARTGWTPEQLDAFLRFQFEAQDRHYRQHFADATYDVITIGQLDAGRLYLLRTPQEHKIIDIALLPEFRGLGAGRLILQRILDDAQDAEVPVTIHVEHTNPARRLYARLGFRQIGDTGVYALMRWQPASHRPDPELS
jgi:ribosomal protein S18 acetylase RimI-like enzyme